MPFKKSRPTIVEARQKAEKYCAYQERSHSEVRNKLFNMGLNSEETDDVLIHLLDHNFLNEERFALAFAGGKFRAKKWGKKKIVYQLKAKGINDKLIRQALGEIKDVDYKETLLAELMKKDATMKDTEKAKRMAKMSRFLFGKGFEQDMVIEAVKKFYNQ